MGQISKEDQMELADAHIKPVSMEDWAERVRARLMYGLPNQRALVCEGEAGCGKSEITKQVCEEMGLEPVICPGLGAQQMEEFLAMIKVVEAGDGNAKILQAVHENLLPTQKLIESGKYDITVKGKKRTALPWIIDEIFTGNMGQMNQLRGFLTFRQAGSVRIPDNTFIIGTTNPEDVIYSTRKSVDGAIMERVEVVRVYMTFEHHQKYLAKQEAVGRYPMVCRLFLRMPEQQDLWKCASPRFWHQGFGMTWMELTEADISEDQRIRLFEQTLSDALQQAALKLTKKRSKKKLPMSAQALIGRFKNFIEHGDDPHFYPISANAVLAADTKKEQEAHTKLFEYWSSKKQQNFIGVTIQDLMTVITDCDEVNKKQAAHVADLLSMSGSGLAFQFFRELYDKKSNTAVFENIYESVAKTPIFNDIRESMKQHDQMIRNLREEKKGLSSI